MKEKINAVHVKWLDVNSGWEQKRKFKKMSARLSQKVLWSRLTLY